MLKQIRLAMGNPENQKFMGTLIEIDETYVGGKPRKGAKKDNDNDDGDLPKNKRGRGTKKNVVVGCVDRTNKSVFAKVMIRTRKAKN
jgi:ISXO2-like transposase domain